jgi:hypothetical protein
MNFYIRGAQIFQKSGSYIKILDAKRVKRSKSYAEDPQVLEATKQNKLSG